MWKSQKRIGCTGGSCSFLCDKSMEGVLLEGQTLRVAAAHFGQATARAPLEHGTKALRCMEGGPRACAAPVAGPWGAAERSVGR